MVVDGCFSEVATFGLLVTLMVDDVWVVDGSGVVIGVFVGVVDGSGVVVGIVEGVLDGSVLVVLSWVVIGAVVGVIVVGSS